MVELRFEWNPAKAKANAKKHGVTFDEASTVFYDEWAVEFTDPDHSEDEDRFLMLGMSAKLRVIVVCHCFRDSESVIRLISARKADRDEKQNYWKRRT